MDKKRLQITITAILVLVLIIAWANSIRILNKRLKSKTAVKAAIVPSPTFNFGGSTESRGVYTDKNNNCQADENLDWKKCPFSGRQYSYSQEAVNFEISGIMWDEAKPKAIINGQILGEGDSIENFLIEKIEKQKVILSDGQKKVELRI